MKFNLSLFLILFVAQLTSCQDNAKTVVVDAQTATMTILEAPAFKDRMEQGDAVIIDVRTPGEISEGMLPGAVAMNIMEWDSFVASVAELDKSKPVMVYCKVGGRSGKAASYLKKEGFTEVYDLEGGYLSWMDYNYPTQK